MAVLAPPKTFVSEALFWLHLSIILFALVVGLLFPWYIVLVLAIAHRVHTWMFNGCVFSKIERRFGSLDQQSDYLQHMIKRFIGKTITSGQSKILDYSLLATTITVTLVYNLIVYSLLPLSSLVLLGSALCGLLASVFLTSIQKQHHAPLCHHSAACNPVLASRFSQVGPIKITELGILFYIICLVIALISLWNIQLVGVLQILGGIGMITTIYLFSVQAFVIRAWCRWCVISGAAAAVFLVGSLHLF